MKKILFPLSLYGMIYATYASSAMESATSQANTNVAATTKSAPRNGIAKTGTDGSNLTAVIVNIKECNESTPCAVIKDSAVILSQAINQDMSDKSTMIMIQKSITPHIDFGLMTRFAMGSAWKLANSDQQRLIVENFKQLLVYQYSASLSKLKGAQVTLDNSIISGVKQNKAAINGTIKMPNNGKSTNQPINIEYDLAKIGSDWKIYEVKIEGVSIVTLYRNQFIETAQTKDGVESLIVQLQSRVAAVQAK